MVFKPTRRGMLKGLFGGIAIACTGIVEKVYSGGTPKITYSGGTPVAPVAPTLPELEAELRKSFESLKEITEFMPAPKIADCSQLSFDRMAGGLHETKRREADFHSKLASRDFVDDPTRQYSVAKLHHGAAKKYDPGITLGHEIMEGGVGCRTSEKNKRIMLANQAAFLAAFAGPNGLQPTESPAGGPTFAGRDARYRKNIRNMEDAYNG